MNSATLPMPACRGGAGCALVFIPQTVNFFNNIAGQRLAEALRNLGWKVRLLSLHDYDGQPADVAILVSIVELFVNCGSPHVARGKLESLRCHCPRVLMWLLEPTHTRWFNHSYQVFHDCGLEILADNALHDQSTDLAPDQRRFYHHLFYGLTEAEKTRVRNLAFEDERRAISWVFVGHKTPERCELARFLIEEIDRGGFLYLTDVTPISETGPHIKDEAFQKVLRRCRYQLWRAHHSTFYMEGERFRRSALAGCVPIKIIVEDTPGSRALPFPYLVVRKPELPALLDPAAFQELRRRFLDEYCDRPSLEDELSRFLEILCADGPPQTVRQLRLAA
jgi:hypothetical protein